MMIRPSAMKMRLWGARAGRDGMSQAVIAAVIEYQSNPTYKAAMILAGALEPITVAARGDVYWDEQVKKGQARTYAMMEKVKGGE